MIETTPATNVNARYRQLDSLRGIAALFVFFSHFFLIFKIDGSLALALKASPLGVFINGHSAVMFFFVLSGFVLSLPFISNEKPLNLAEFYIKRIFRNTWIKIKIYMAYNERLADRIRELLADAKVDVFEKRMFSGLSFLVDDKMCVSVAANDRILVRLSPAYYEEAAEKNGVELMMRNGKAMKGYVFVNLEVLQTGKELKHWVDMALAFNPVAKSSKK